MITYDIDLDFKIIGTIYSKEDRICNHSDLRTSVISAPGKLDNHLNNLEKWGLITNNEPESMGHPRKIELKGSIDHAMFRLEELKRAIDTVNNYFCVTDTNPNEEKEGSDTNT